MKLQNRKIDFDDSEKLHDQKNILFYFSFIFNNLFDGQRNP